MRSVNPATGEELRSYDELDDDGLGAALDAAHGAFRAWRERPLEERVQPLRAAAEALRARADELAALMAREMGKPVSEGRGEAKKCAWVCEYYADGAGDFLAPQAVEADASRSKVAFEPLGPVLAVMPWNFPLWQVFRFAAPALAAGNVGLLKHASNVPGCALAIEELLREAGLPDGVFRTLLIGSGRVADVIAHPSVAAVTLTGSTPAGRAVAAEAGRNLKKTVLELGGSDPYVVLDDADLDVAVEACVTSRFLNAGQSCIAAKRFIVTPKVRDEFERRFVARTRELKVGDPLDDDTQVGPMARADLRDELHDQVRRSIASGARALLGCAPPEGPGAFYPPSVLADVRAGMPAADEELFGPVAAILPVADEEEALRVANDTPFGLGAAVFTRDAARGEELATKRLEAGSCFVNDFVRSDPRLPFGGIKGSGYGRELGPFGIREFVNVKTVCVR